ncbi:MAG TPA: aldo/keto reductase [Vitreimonas sp.]|nr:aldo/keto reductase [Vitreimonas sp.]
MKTLTLNNGQMMPGLGLGTWRGDKVQVTEAVRFAILEAGYRHIDCASIYGNEKEIGQAFTKVFATQDVSRQDLFVTSKLWNTDHHPDRVKQACRQTLADLQLEYLDLYLVHWGVAFQPGGELEPLDENGKVKTEPVPTQATWQAMENLVDKGLVKSIGVANFTTTMLIDLLSYARIKPVTNQVEIHPYNSQAELVDFCHYHQITITAYSPLGSQGSDHKPLDDATVAAIAQKHDKSAAQVLIRWAVQRQLSVIPKSTQPERIRENSQVFDFELSEAEMAQLNSLNQNRRYVDPIEWWGIPYFK